MLAHLCARNIAKLMCTTTISPTICSSVRLLHITKQPLRKQGVEYLTCKLRSYDNLLSPWFLLRKVGVPNRKIVSFRRGLKRFSYPWVEYCIPIALIMTVGDILAQLVCIEKDQRKEFNPCRTLKYALIGFFFLGPLLSRWNLYLYCRLRASPPIRFILTKALLDTLVFAPPILAGMIILYDHAYLEKADKPMLKRVWCDKYARHFIEILRINLLTRPVVALLNCLVMPRFLRRHIRSLYELALAVFVSKEFARASYGMTFDEYTKQQTDKEKKSKTPIPPPHTSFCLCMQYLLGWLWSIECCKDCGTNKKPTPPPGKK